MILMKYNGEKNSHEINFKKINSHIVQITGDFPVKKKGFVCFREGNKDDKWSYKDYTTVYREVEGGAQFSNDGSVYVAPPETEPEPTPEPEPYVPTLEEVKEEKINEMNMVQQNVIQEGIEVTLTGGSVEHFTLTANDQISLMGLQTQVAAGADQIQWHTSNHDEHCKYYSNADMQVIITAAMQYVSYHVTYFRDLRIYINSLEDKETVRAVVYGMPIPETYQSEVLRDMCAAMEG